MVHATVRMRKESCAGGALIFERHRHTRNKNAPPLASLACNYRGMRDVRKTGNRDET